MATYAPSTLGLTALTPTHSQVSNECRLYSKNLNGLPERSMLHPYLKSKQTVDKLIAAANKGHASEVENVGGAEDNNVAVERLDNFMRKKTDKRTLKQGHKDAKRMGSKA